VLLHENKTKIKTTIQILRGINQVFRGSKDKTEKNQDRLITDSLGAQLLQSTVLHVIKTHN